MKPAIISNGRQGDMPADWFILSQADRAMDLHLRLLADAASEALRAVTAAEEFGNRRPASRRG